MHFKMTQAQEAWEEARGLLEDGAELQYVANSLYYAYYYPVLALLRKHDLSAGMQSVSIGLFEKHFIETGAIDARFGKALRRAFELKPKCGTVELKQFDRAEIESLLADALDFHRALAQEQAA
jgi:uncharacterized protein (UPF0332 family)